jgi:hypothetical protein
MRRASADSNQGDPRPACSSASLGYVFVHIPKCAGTSIHRALGGLHERRSLRIEGRKYHKHAKAAEVRRVLGPAWDNAFKFSFVRNPWDLMVSSYHWWLARAGDFPRLTSHVSRIRELGSFSAFISSKYGSKMLNEQPGRDLLEWVSDGTGIIVDFVGKYENLDEDWKHVCQALGVEPVVLARENQVPRENYRSFYDETSRGLVANRFARSIEVFGYQF